MKITLILAASALALSSPAAGQTRLECPELAPPARSQKVLRMQPLRRGKDWLAGAPKSVNSVSCDKYGMKTAEEEYDGKTLVFSRSYSYAGTEEARAFCAGLKSEEKLTTTFSDEARSSLDDFCRRNRKNDFTMALVFDAARGKESSRKPLRRIFRIFNKKGFVTEEHSFDPMMSLETVTLHAYDKKNNLVQTAVNDFDGRQLSREAFSRDKATASRTVLAYDENNQLRRKTAEELREDGTLRRRVVTEFDSGEQPVTRREVYCDAKGNPEKELVYGADEAEAKYEYDYVYALDKNGNWTEERRTRAIVYNGRRLKDSQSPPDITRRELLYY